MTALTSLFIALLPVRGTGRLSTLFWNCERGGLPSEGKGHTFESCRARQWNQLLSEFLDIGLSDRVSAG